MVEGVIYPVTDEEIAGTPCGLLWSPSGKIVGRHFTFAGYTNVECLLCGFLERSPGMLTGKLKGNLMDHMKSVHRGLWFEEVSGNEHPSSG